MSTSQMYASNFAQQGSSQGVVHFNFHSVNVKQYTLQSCQISKQKDEFMVWILHLPSGFQSFPPEREHFAGFWKA